jgi:hypothetical protein
VYVEVVYGLSSPWPVVDNRAVAFDLKLPFPRKLGSHRKETAQHRAIAVISFLQ